MTNAYSELYLDDAMHNLGDMVEYAVCDLGFDPDTFFGWFIFSGIAEQFENGNPKYLTGMSGYELAAAVLKVSIFLSKTESLPTPTTKAGNIGQAGFLPTISGTLADALKIL